MKTFGFLKNKEITECLYSFAKGLSSLLSLITQNILSCDLGGISGAVTQ